MRVRTCLVLEGPGTAADGATEQECFCCGLESGKEAATAPRPRAADKEAAAGAMATLSTRLTQLELIHAAKTVRVSNVRTICKPTTQYSSECYGGEMHPGGGLLAQISAAVALKEV